MARYTNGTGHFRVRQLCSVTMDTSLATQTQPPRFVRPMELGVGTQGRVIVSYFPCLRHNKSTFVKTIFLVQDHSETI